MTIDLKSISKHFSQQENSLYILENITFSFHRKHSYAIIGSSGIGKSTLIHMLAGIESPSSGDITVNNSSIISQNMSLLQNAFSLVFQQPYLLNELSVLENILLKKIALSSITTQDKDKAYLLLKNINLEQKAHANPATLSGGEQQKIALLRAIFITPQFLFADEPTGNLDELSANVISNLLLDYAKEYNMGLIITTHDIKVANKCDYILKIENRSLVIVKKP